MINAFGRAVEWNLMYDNFEFPITNAKHTQRNQENNLFHNHIKT